MLFVLMGNPVFMCLYDCAISFPTLFLPVYCSSSPLPLVGPGLWEVVSLEILLGKGPADEETVSSLVQGRLCLEN